MFSEFRGNFAVVAALRRLLAEQRLPQTLLFAGPAGVGKATLARLVAAALNCTEAGADPCGRCSHCRRILQADLSLPEYRKLFDERARLPLERRRENPLVIATHPEFLTFPPDGPLPQISIEQVRMLNNHARLAPSQGRRRLFLVDQGDRIDSAAANSLLKTLEEPPPYLTLILTAENAYELLPTIRSRCIPFFFGPLSADDVQRFLEARPEIAPSDRDRLAAWAGGSPGRALSLDMAVYAKRRQAMLALLRAGARAAPFRDLLAHTEGIGRSKQERLEWLLDTLYVLLHDMFHIQHGEPLVNEDLRPELAELAGRVDFAWIEKAMAWLDELDRLTRRNIQKQIALEALAMDLHPGLHAGGPRLSPAS